MKFLIVDDHPVFRQGVAQILSGLDSAPTILQAESVAAARRAIDRIDDFDLILVDLLMPEESGLNLLQELSERTLVVPAVAMSGETNVNLVKLALDFGSLGFIPKSTQPDELRLAIEQILAGGYYIPEALQTLLNNPDSQEVPEVAKEIGITRKQYAVLTLMAEGRGNRDIASLLNLTEHTVKSHSQALFSAMGVKNRTACVAQAQALDIIQPTRMTVRSVNGGS